MPSNATNTKRQPAASSPELLMAASRGDWERLDALMSSEGARVPQVTIDIDMDINEVECSALDSLFHAVVSGGDDEQFLMTSTVICRDRKAKHLWSRCNAMSDTAFHCAARAGSIIMINHLIDLARDSTYLQEALRKQNKQGETVLHEAVRRADEEMVGVLMAADPELACIPSSNGASPLYLAIFLEHYNIAKQLQGMNNELSYSGPDGQNALHTAVVRNQSMTRKLLEWNKELIKHGEGSKGRTPLHFVASSPGRETGTMAKLLLDADESSAYQPDHEGLLPIHVAVLQCNLGVVKALLQKCPDCAQLRDTTQGRTVVHAAAIEGHSSILRWAVRFLRDKYASQLHKFASIMNMRDNEGNTALHHAVKSGSTWTVHTFIRHKEVQLNIQNNKGQTALDVAWSMRAQAGVFYTLDPSIRIHLLLLRVGAKRSDQRYVMKAQARELDVEVEGKKIQDSTMTVSVVSVLIITISFAAAFQLPGGYSSGGDKPEGTPELANKYSFQAFVLANVLAAFCSSMATISLMIAGITAVDIDTRMAAFRISTIFVNNSARCLIAAFAFGTYAVLAPVAHAAAVLTWLFAGLMLLDIAWFACTVTVDALVLLYRTSIGAFVKAACLIIVVVPLVRLWPYVVIGGFIAYLKVHGIH